MKFQIEQVALCPKDPVAARALLSALGLDIWVHDHVIATGKVFDAPDCTNEADLSFNYQSTVVQPAPLEVELLHYTAGRNWMASYEPAVSHLGMHCTAEELVAWREKFAALGITVAQEVVTNSHTNEHIRDTRRYNYVIFNTREILGVDLKFIVRLPVRS